MSIPSTEAVKTQFGSAIRALLFLPIAGLSIASGAGNCTNPAIVWTIYNNYTDSATGLAMSGNISGDGLKTDSSGNTVYSPSGGAVQVASQIFRCSSAQSPSYDAVLNITKGRSFRVNLGFQLGNTYQKFPPSSSMPGTLLNVSDIQWCQNHGMPNGCTFYTALTTALSGSDGKVYHLRMENPSPGVPVTSWSFDSTANCPYFTSPVQVVFTPGSLHSSGKDTYEVTPVLQGSNMGTEWTAPAASLGCPASTLPAGSWPAGIGSLILDGTGNSYNYGQYNVPFKLVIQNQ